MADAAEQYVNHQTGTPGQGLARREMAIRKAQIPLKQAEVREMVVRINQVKRRLKEVDSLVKLAQSKVPPEGKPAAHPAPPAAK